MFHIKTDIRQFKCESAEKVERLIRNWIIRPSDLVYNAHEKTWNPIGQHPAFDDIFAGIEKEEANEPDTIVTEAPSEVAAEHEVEPGTELEAHADTAVAGEATTGEETTNVRPAPEKAEEPQKPAECATSAAMTGEAVTGAAVVVEAKVATLAADSEEITNVTEAPEAAPDEITDVREDPRRDTTEQDAAEQNAADAPVPAPPEPSDEVEGLIRDSDEITMMTDKTFEMLSAERNAGASKTDASTQDDSEPEEDEASATADEQPAAGAPEEPEEPDEAPGEEADEDAGDDDESGASSGGGRHGLPEEVFVTDEIPRQDVQQAVLDDLRELREEVEPDEDDEVTELIDRDADADDSEERKSRWRIVMSDDLDEDAVDESALDEDAVDESALDDDAGEESARDDEADDTGASDREAGTAPSGEADRGSEAHEDLSYDSTAEDDELDEMLDEAAELVGLGEDSAPVDIDGGALEAVEGEEGDGRERADTPVRAVAEPKEFISEGYNLPLPVDISPSREDIRLGLVHSRVGKPLKDATFPYPKPKKRDEVTCREYDLDPEDPADHSVLIVAAFLVGVLIIVLAAVTIFG